MALQAKYIKLLEERVEELQQQLANEQKKKSPTMVSEELIVKYLAHVLQINSGDKVPTIYRWGPAKCLAKAESSTKAVYNISKRVIEVDQKYIDIIQEAMQKLEV